jgi:hypothetical protein
MCKCPSIICCTCGKLAQIHEAYDKEQRIEPTVTDEEQEKLMWYQWEEIQKRIFHDNQ